MAEITYGSLWQLLAVPHSPKLSVERTCRSKAQLRTRDRIGNMFRKSTESEMGCKLYPLSPLHSLMAQKKVKLEVPILPSAQEDAKGASESGDY